MEHFGDPRMNDIVAEAASRPVHTRQWVVHYLGDSGPVKYKTVELSSREHHAEVSVPA